MNEQIKQLLLQLSMIPGLDSSIRGIIDFLIGKAPYGLNWLTINNQKSLGWNVAAAERSGFSQANLMPQHAAVASQALKNTMTNLYSFAGYRGDALDKAVEGAMTGPVAQFAATMLAPQVAAAYSDFGNASYRRMAARATADGSAAFRTAQESYGSILGGFYKDVISDTISGKMAGLDVGDVGKIASQMIGTGALEGNGMTDPSAFKSRVDRIKRELLSYSQSVGVLKDVIDGPVEDILKSFEVLTGNKLTSMSAGRAEMMSNAMQSAMFIGGVTPQQLATYIARQYGLIDPYGGTLQQANAMAVATASAVSSGVRIEGLSDVQLGEALARDNANKLISGELRRKAAAYQHWRLKRGREDNAFTMEEYRRYMDQEHLDPDAYLKRHANEIDESFYASRLVTNTMANAEFLTSSRANQLKEYQTAVKNIDLTKFGDEKKQASIRNIISNEYDPSRMLERLRLEAGLDINSANRVVEQVQVAAMGSFQTNNELEALGMAGTAANADRMQRMKLGGIALQRLRGQQITAGGEGLLKYLVSDPARVSPGVASLLSTWLSGNPADATMAENDLYGILSDRDENGKLTEAAQRRLKERLGGLGDANIDALLGASGDKWTKNTVLTGAASAMIKADSDLLKGATPEEREKAVVAKRQELMTAIRTGMSGDKALTMTELKRLGADFEFSEKDIYAQLLASRRGGGAINEGDITRFMRMAKDAESDLQKDFLAKRKKTSRSQLSEKDQKEYDTLTDKAADFAALKDQGQQAVDMIRIAGGKAGTRMSADETVAAIMKARSETTPEGGAPSLEKQAWDTAARMYKLRTGEDLSKASEDDIKKYLSESLVKKGGMEDILQGLLDALLGLVPAINRLIDSINGDSTGSGKSPGGGKK